MARFAPLYDVPIEDASVDIRCTFDVADKLDLEGPGAAFQEVAERGCHAEQSFRKPVPVRTTATLNGAPLAL